MNFFPVNLNIEKKLCVVIGGGKVGERKVKNLLNYNAQIRVVSKEFTDNILKLSNVIEIIKDEYKPEYIENAFLLFICTNNFDINLKIYNDAKKNGALVNIVTHPELCDFSIPSVVNRGSLKIAISTDGKSPALSKILRKEIEVNYGEEYKNIVEIMGKIREKQLTAGKCSDMNSELFYKFLEIALQNNNNNLNQIIKKIFGFEI